MRRLRTLFIFVVFALVVSAYYFIVSPLITKQKVFYYEDEFNHGNKEFWYAASIEDHKELNPKDFIATHLSLRKYDPVGDVYFLSKPIALGKNQIFRVKRRLRVNPAQDYFSGGLALFQTSSKYRVVDAEEKHPFGSALALVEYVYNPKAIGERPGRNNIRILAPDYQKEDNYLLLDPMFNKWFEEELIYNAADGRLTYSVNGEVENITVVPLSDKYVRVWMHAYGISKLQEIEVERVEIEVKNP